MATAKKTTPKTAATEVVDAPVKAGKAIVPKTAAADLALVAEDFLEQFAGNGMEGVDSESFAIPFLAVLQKTSPAADGDSPEYIEGARPGMFFETVSRSIFDGKEGVMIVPCAYKREFIRWGADDGNEKYKGSYTPEQVNQMTASGAVKELDNRLYFPLPDGSVSEKKCDRLSDTRNHYILIIGKDGAWTRALMSLASTQIKKSKHLMSALSNVKLRGAAGLYTPPTFSNVVLAQTKLEQNDKGSWHGLQFTLQGREGLTKDIFMDAKAFCDEVHKGTVETNFDNAPEGVRSAAPSAGNGF